MNENTMMQVMNTNDVAKVDALNSLNAPANSFFSSIENDGSRASLVKIYNAVNSANEKLDDHKGEVIKLVDVVAHPITLTDENTAEVVDCVRVVLIAEDGTSYEAVSQGIVSSLSKMFAIVGKPTYSPALPVKVVEQKTRKGYKTNTLELV